MRTVVIDSRWRLWPDLRELWQGRETLFFLTLRALQIRYRQAVLGIAWALFQPLFASLLFWMVFSRVTTAQPGGVSYPLFAFTGMVLWTFFAASIARCNESITGNADMIRRIYFPRIFVPASEVLACGVDLVLSLCLLLPVIGFLRGFPSSPWIWFVSVVLLLCLGLIALSCGMVAAALNARFRDLRFVIPFVVQLGLFATPVLYDVAMISPGLRKVLLLSPLAKIILQFRDGLLFGRYPEPYKLVGAVLGSLVLFLAAFVLFRVMERKMADLV